MYLLLLLLSVITLAHHSVAAETATLIIRVDNITEERGMIAYKLFDSEAAYRSRTKTIRSGFAPIHALACTIDIEGLQPGRYAAVFYHDRNNNKKLDHGLFHIPTEPAAFSNHAQPRFGPPAFEDAAFDIHAGENPVHVELQ
ncbi:DUF2141 domain-containing protein [Mariprofundus erugo]|uniref:DUF2141 domain-containing protein n=1 Tax=Mariprofundus erugo TaxID=2528639 RepID=A0A5R9GQ98_9PROT|nr:DUF2141 domain-containing protein [Mariprofundus erugo]TLS65304.1 DUF2141 domain-containing protein [Mariprofundus erugo]TLS76847.1 DUF2141 domain-containing protein [Mariprofundus erugo]